MAVLWGVPYLFISEAVASFSPAAVVSGRTLGGAVILLPIALHRRALGPALRRWPWVLAFGAIEMGGPFFLLSDAERTIPSGLTGLLVSTVPLWAVVIGFSIGTHRSVSPWRIIGLLVGFGGVAVVVGGQGMAVTDAASTFVAVGEVLLTALLYAIAPFIVSAKLSDVPSLGPISLALVAVGLVYLPFALLTQHEVPAPRSIVALAALAVLCTAVAFVAFFALIGEVGPVTAPLFTYVNPIVAIALGIIILGEPLSPWLLLGFPLVLAGCWLAATGGRWRPAAAPQPVSAAGAGALDDVTRSARESADP
ncbi:DMT family transporter [Microbacterium protaetiae]|uniref:DMT family transporter n=2 Tax=Microbacterium protaetiae TaxID=2509458 RepID=A0A4P6EUD1_9MICO|nr:DMT family transporter [Microbacterium protaetiae]